MGESALKLIEGTKEDRDKYISKIDVLEKVGKLITLPDGEQITTKQVADYFNVSENTIRVIRNRHKKELESDGVKTLRSKEIKELKSKFSSLQDEMNKVFTYLTVYTRRSVLRIGMLLTESEIAEKVRDYLLNIEEQATEEQKQKAINFDGTWTKEADDFVVDYMNNSLLNGSPVKRSLEEVAKELNTTFGKVYVRWYTDKLRLNLDEKAKANIQYTKPLDAQELETNRIITTLNNVLESNENLYKSFGTLWRGQKELLEQQRELNNAFNDLHNHIINIDTKVEKIINEEIESLKKRVKGLNNKLKKSNQENDDLLKFIGKSSIMSDSYIEQESGSKQMAFKMERNGNLKKI